MGQNGLEMVERPRGGQVILYVSDMNRALRFWRDQVGLSLLSPLDLEDFSAEFWVVLDAGPFSLCLHPDLEPGSVAGSAFSLLVEDIEEFARGLAQRGVAHSGVLNPHPGVVLCRFQDPDGHICFIKPVPEDASTA